MLTEYVTQRAGQAGVTLSKVRLIDGDSVGCSDSCLLEITSQRHTVTILLYKSEIVNHKNGSRTGLFPLKIDAALVKLKMMHTV